MQTLPMKFACSSVVLREGDTNSGTTEIFQPWADAVVEGYSGRIDWTLFRDGRSGL